MTEFYVKVRPGSERFGIENGHMLEVDLENEAENGRANAELVRRLEEILGARPGIVSGHKSSRKKIKIDLESSKVDKRLEEFIDG